LEVSLPKATKIIVDGEPGRSKDKPMLDKPMLDKPILDSMMGEKNAPDKVQVSSVPGLTVPLRDDEENYPVWEQWWVRRSGRGIIRGLSLALFATATVVSASLILCLFALFGCKLGIDRALIWLCIEGKEVLSNRPFLRSGDGDILGNWCPVVDVMGVGLVTLLLILIRNGFVKKRSLMIYKLGALCPNALTLTLDPLKAP